MQQTSVCGVNRPFEQAPSKALESLLKQFGRNGPLSDDQEARKTEIEAILMARKKSGVIIEDDGTVYHRV